MAEAREVVRASLPGSRAMIELILAAAIAGKLPPEIPEHEKWFFEQITQTSVDSGTFIVNAGAGAPSVIIHNFPTSERCENARAQLGALSFGVDQPMGTGSYFARIGAWLSVCIQRK